MTHTRKRDLFDPNIPANITVKGISTGRAIKIIASIRTGKSLNLPRLSRKPKEGNDYRKILGYAFHFYSKQGVRISSV